MDVELSPEILLSAYAQGIFPMAVEDEDGEEIQWFSPDPRAIFDLDDFHVPRTLRQFYRQKHFDLAIDRAFEQVIDACAVREEGTWINSDIREAYIRLHKLGFAHSVEAWDGDDLVGGLYGVALGGAFFGESMFHRATNASKVCLVYLVERMRACGFSLLDTQFTTPHLKQFNVKLIERDEYIRRLTRAIGKPCTLQTTQSTGR